MSNDLIYLNERDLTLGNLPNGQVKKNIRIDYKPISISNSRFLIYASPIYLWGAGLFGDSMYYVYTGKNLFDSVIEFGCSILGIFIIEIDRRKIRNRNLENKLTGE